MKLFFFGPSGAGKSTVITWLNEKLQYDVLQIDHYRALYGDYSWQGFHRANQLFVEDIGSGNQVIECSGIGKLGELVRHRIYTIQDDIHIIILLARPSVCRSRNLSKSWYALKLPYRSVSDIHAMLGDQGAYEQLPLLYHAYHPLLYNNNSSYDLERIKAELSRRFF